MTGTVYLNAWIDYNKDGVWEAAEHIFGGAALAMTASGPISFDVPDWAAPGATYARFRLSSDPNLSFDGLAADGEVEDYFGYIQRIDYGDASVADMTNPARHVFTSTPAVPGGPLLVAGPWLGSTAPDHDLPFPDDWKSDDDTLLGIDDEDEGDITFANALGIAGLIPGEMASVDVKVNNADGLVYAWIDFNGDGDFDDSFTETWSGVEYTWSEFVVTGVPAAAGGSTGAQSFRVPHNVDAQTVAARFRVVDPSEGWTPSATGIAYSGEVEDHTVQILPVDYGDAPNSGDPLTYPSFPTQRAADGARHVIAGPVLGAAVDHDWDGQPTPLADGDGSDEDGLDFLAARLIPGETTTLDVTLSNVTGTVYLNAWIDYNGDGMWEAAEHIFGGTAWTINAAGVTTVTFDVPETAARGATYARFRISSDPNLSFDGLAADGEVEDYLGYIQQVDFGDAPDDYGTLRQSHGPRHVVYGPTLGSLVDHDDNGQPTAGADGDDLDAVPNDEDGVALTTQVGNDVLIPGEWATFTINVAGGVAADVHGWLDLNRNNTWDADEDFLHLYGVAGPQVVSYLVPQNAQPGATYARFRVVANAEGWTPSPWGLAQSGEVEDYRYTVRAIDYGDAPWSYHTQREDEGARHLIDMTGPYLGQVVDHDVDGIPSDGADSDDLLDLDDEDGVTFSNLLWIGYTGGEDPFRAYYDVLAPVGGYLDVWVDFNRNGVWEDTVDITEHIAQSVWIDGSPTEQRFYFDVPANAVYGDSYARVRITSTGKDVSGNDLTPTGLAADGEVEDYTVFLDTAPVAVPGGPYWINTNEDLVLDASGSWDLTDPIVRYEWDFTYDPSSPDPERNTFNPDISFDGPVGVIPWPWFPVLKGSEIPTAPIPIYLRVVDSFGAVSPIVDTTLQIFQNVPTASFVVTTAPVAGKYVPGTIDFDAAASSHDREYPDYDKHLVKYEWDFDWNGTFSPDVTKNAWVWNGSDWTTAGADADPENASWIYSRYGIYTVVLRVTDSNSPAKTDLYSTTIDVTGGNSAPMADAGGAYDVNIGNAIQLDGSGSLMGSNTANSATDAARGDSIASWQWDLNGDGAIDATGSNPTISAELLETLGLIPAVGAGSKANQIRLRVTDSLGLWTEATTTLTVYENRPHAVASSPTSPLSIAPGDTVDFNGTPSWHDRADIHKIARYEWSFGDGSAAVVQTNTIDPNFGKVSHTYTQFGQYTATMRVGDDNAPQRFDTLQFQIVVNQGDVLPVAVPGGPYTVATGGNIVLDAGGSHDPNAAAGDSITAYKWTLKTDGADLVVTTASPTFPLTWANHLGGRVTPGMDYALTLEVTDRAIPGVVNADTSVPVATTLRVRDDAVSVDVDLTNDPNPDPDNVIARGFAAEFQATAANPIGTPIAAYAWDFDYDGTFQADPVANGATVTHAFSMFGNYQVAVRATDTAGKWAVAVVDVQVSEGNSAPIADAGGPMLYAGAPAYFLDFGQALVLSAAGSTDPELQYGDAIVSYQWDLDNDGAYDDASGVAPTIAWNDLQAMGLATLGPHTIGVSVTDSFGLSDTDESQFVVFINEPNAVIAMSDLDGVVAPTTEVDFDGTGSTTGRPDRVIAKYEWDFNGDGQYEVVQDNPLAANFGKVDDVTFPMFQQYTVSLRITDSNSPAKTDTASITVDVSEGNQAPKAVFSLPAKILAGSGITLNGSASYDPDAAAGDAIETYAWTVGGIHLVGFTGATAVLTWNDLTGLGVPTDGTPIQVTLTVTDKFQNTDVATKSFAVVDDLLTSFFTASPNPVACNTNVAFDGSGSSQTNGQISKYEWDFNYDGDTFDVDAQGVNATHSFSQFGEYDVALRVTGSGSETAVSVLTVVVSLGNVAPVADAGGPYTFGVGQQIVLDAGDSYDPNEACGDSIVAYRWDLDNDGQFDDASGAEVTLPAGYFAAGESTIGLQVEDRQGGLRGTTTTTVTVVTNTPPDADAGGPYTVSEGTALILDGTGSTDDAPGLTYQWDLNYDGVTFDVDKTGPQPSVTFTDNFAARTIALRVIDAGPLSDIATTTLTVLNVAPTAAFGDLPTDAVEGQSIELSGTATDPGADDTHTYAWTVTLGGTQVASGNTKDLSFVPGDNGVYQVQLTVTDDDGGQDVVSESLTVLNANPVVGQLNLTPINTIDGQNLVSMGATVSLTGSFTDAGTLDTHTVSIVWGDGTTSNATVNQEAGTFQATHAYAAGGMFNVVATVTDDDSGSGQGTAVANVVGNLGTVDFTDDVADLDLSLGDRWYELTTAHDGILTVELAGEGASSAAATLYDADGNPVAPMTDGPSWGADYVVDAGTKFFLKLSGTAADVDLRLTNLVSVDGSAITVLGTGADDGFEFIVAESYLVRINGTEYHFDDVAGVAETVSFDGGLGTDSATFTGGLADESAIFFTGRGQFFSGIDVFDQTGYSVEALAENLAAYNNGGGATAKLYDSPGDDVFTSSPTVSTLVGPGYSHAVHGFPSALGYATNRGGDDRSGGDDQAIMHDSEGKDKFKFDWANNEDYFGILYGTGYYNRAKNFESTEAVSTGRMGTARVYGSKANEEFFMSRAVGRVTGPGYHVEYTGFDNVIAYAGGGYDIARFEDSTLNDEIRGRAHKTMMYDQDHSAYELTARAFDEVYAEAKNGGYDKAKMQPTAATELLTVREIDGQTWAKMVIDDAVDDPLYEALAFEWVRAYSSEGDDKVDRTEEFDWLILDPGWTDI